MFIGGKILDSDEGEAVLAEFESRLLDSEARMREYDAVLGDREQELSLTHRVSKQQATPPPAHPRPRVSHFALRLNTKITFLRGMPLSVVPRNHSDWLYPQFRGLD